MRIIRTVAGVVTAVALAFTATACSVSIVDRTAPSESSSTDAGSKGVEKTASDAPAAPDAAGATRDDITARAARTLRCDGELTMLDDAVVVRIDGSCDRLILNTTGSQVVAEDIGTLEVIGDNNLVLTGAVDHLTVNGESNIVHWTGATPNVTDVGDTNTLTAG
ncbi:MAG: hypothetical protein LBU78_05360 [Microbacterium sp.]|jgi:hypothetical protein|nr:hypothetical protein [Microbacterium sp.]